MSNSKVDFVEALFILSLNGLAEILELLLGLTGIGLFISIFVSFIASAVNCLYLFLIKGVRGKNQWVAYGVGVGSDLLTGGVLPTRTISLAVNMWIHNKAVQSEEEQEEGVGEDREEGDSIEDATNQKQSNENMYADNYEDEGEQLPQAA